MTDKTDPSADPQGDSGADAEKHYWDEHEKRTRAILDGWFDDKKKELGSSRNGGRATLPKIFADLVFGPEK
jgi:hypothetical protein